MTNPHLSYRPDIDGLRAIAILSVVVFHVFPGWAPGGFVGVDIFFVISGYLISGIILRGLERGNFSFTEFYARRIKRIFPALTLVLLSCLLFGWFSLFANEYKMLGKHSAAGAAFFANLVFIGEAGYFDTAAELKPLLHLWSLGIEEQFYIFWPALLFLAYRGKLNLLKITLLIALASFALNISRIEASPVSTFYSPLSRVWELLIGSTLAYINFHKREKFDGFLGRFAYNFLQHSKFDNLKSWIGLILIALAVFALNKNILFPYWWAIFPTTGALLLISAGPNAWLNRNLLSRKVLVFIGLISFPLYLWHWPLLSFARILESGMITQEVRLFIVALSFLLAWLTYRLIEKHLRFRKHWFVTFALVLALSLVAALSYNIDRRDGLSFRHKASEIQLDPFNWDKNGLNRQPDCTKHYKELGVDYCLRSSNKPPAVVLIGDSHANHLFYGLEHFYAKSKQDLLNIGIGGCPPFYNLESWRKREGEVCGTYMNKMLDYVLHESNIKTVVLAGSWTQYTSGEAHGNEMRERDFRLKFSHDPLNQDNLDIFGQAMDYTLLHLVNAGKEVVFIFDIWELGFDPKICLKKTPLKFRSQKTSCAVERENFEERNRIYRTKVTEILQKHPSVKQWDPSKELCDNQYCMAMKEETMLYRDDSHLSLDGSLYLGERYNPK